MNEKFMGRLIDLTGKRFGKWTVLYRAEDHIDKHGYRHRRWHCICDCEKHTEKDVLESSLLNNTSTSCGCNRHKIKHGLSRTRIKRIYYDMHSRCENPNTPKFKNHGGRGIKICKEWSGENGLVNFYNWAIDNGYKEDLTIDRVDNDGDYEPNNCRWSDYKTQNLNNRANRYITVGDETKTVSEWSEETGINRNTITRRLNSGITGEEALAPRKIYGGCSSGFVGVFYRKDSGKWRSSIHKDGVKYNLGTYEKLSDAVKARLDGELEHYGRYLSDLNEINEKLKMLNEKE